jgi:hypothetical protein
VNKHREQFNLRLDQLLGLQSEAFTLPGDYQERAALETAHLIHRLDFDAEMKPKGNWAFQPSHPRSTFMQTLRAKPALMILFVVLALALLSGAAYAIGRSLGYIPGVGIIEQGTSIRVLAEPVSQTREGITLTVDQAYLTPERTILSYTVSGIPLEARPKSEAGFSCNPSAPTLRLSDGTLLESRGGEGSGEMDGYRSTSFYPPIPTTEQFVTFLLPCLHDVAPAAAPQDWELPLRFAPAPPDLTVAPVLQIATPPPTSTPRLAVSLMQSDSFMGLTYHLESVQNAGRGYLIETGLRWEPGLFEDFGVGMNGPIKAQDSAGQELHLTVIETFYHTTSAPRHSPITHSLDNKPYAAPITLTLSSIGVNLPQDNRPQFIFDPGPNPQPGQEWPINQTIEVLGWSVEILSARYVTYADLPKEEWWVTFTPEEAHGFEISLRADPKIDSMYLSIESGFSPDGGPAGGYPLERDENGIMKIYPLMGGRIVAPLVFNVTYLTIQHDWQLTFDPHALAGEATPESASIDVRLQIEQVIPLEDGYYLVGRTLWDDPRFAYVGIGGWDTRLLAPDGREIPIEPAWDEIGIPDPQPGQWGYRVYGRALPASLTLSMSQASIQLTQPYTFTFQPDTAPQQGLEWRLDQTLDILGHSVIIESARYITEADSQGFEFTISAPENIPYFPFIGMESGIVGGYTSGGSGEPRDETGKIKASTVMGGQFTGEPILFTIRNIILNGNWQIDWNPPPAPAGATPFYAPQACLTLDSVKQALANPPALPPGLTGKLLQMRGALAPDPTLFVANLDGSGEIPLVFGHGTLSPDGRLLAYTSQNGQLTMMEISDQNKAVLGEGFLAPHWSPDGTKIAFQRETPKGFNIFVINADGSNLRQLTDTTGLLFINGWLRDGQSLLIQTGGRIERLNVNNGSRAILLTTQYDALGSPSAIISPDEQWLAYLDKVPGAMSPGLYISRLDGTDQRLLAQLEHWMIFSPVFSPDGQWLAFSINYSNLPSLVQVTPLIMNIQTCQVFPLNGLQGEIRQWLQP